MTEELDAILEPEITLKWVDMFSTALGLKEAFRDQM